MRKNQEIISWRKGFKKDLPALFSSGSLNFSSFKNSLVQINSKLNWRPYDYLYEQREMTKFCVNG